MIATFIQAANKVQLVKNLITNEPYPNVVEVNSFEHNVKNLTELYAAIDLHASQGHAMLVGKLGKQLRNESRAGHTLREPAEYLLLDIDNDDLPYSSRTALVAAVCGQQTQFVFQASAKAKSDDSLRGHYWIPLSQPESPDKIKQWLKQVNFDLFEDHIGLSNSKNALKWPLDIVVNDPGRIVFIAPPIQEKDPLTKRIHLSLDGTEFTLPETIRPIDVQAKVDSLRLTESLPQREKPVNNVAIVSANEVKITGIKEGNKFVYLNLNGGDSWGYYFALDNPEIVYNFKEEPNFRLAELNPALYEKYKPTPIVSPRDIDLVNGELVVRKAAVFRDPETDIFWQVLYDPSTNRKLHAWKTHTKGNAEDFMVMHGEPKPKPIKLGTAIYDPRCKTQWDPTERYLNQFEPTKYLEIQRTQEHCPKHIEKLLRHLLVDNECYEHFMNWLAFIFQNRDMTGKAWMLHGTTGTGKGTLYAEILKPIFGRSAITCRAEQLLEQFNDELETSLIVFVDEFDINDASKGVQSFNKLKNYISESDITIRGMRKGKVQKPNFCNYIFASNALTPIKIDPSERRLNIPPRQNETNASLPEWRAAIANELESFCAYLKGYKVNVAKAKKPLMNKAREEMIIDSRNSHEDFFHALNVGDIEFFAGFAEMSNSDIYGQSVYKTLIDRWEADMEKGDVDVLFDDLVIAYKYIVDPKVCPNKFRVICRKNNLKFELNRNSKRRYYYIPVTFKYEVVSTEMPSTPPLKLVK